MGVKLRRHDVLKGRNWIKALLLICSTASAFGLLLVFSIRVGFLFWPQDLSSAVCILALVNVQIGLGLRWELPGGFWVDKRRGYCGYYWYASRRIRTKLVNKWRNFSSRCGYATVVLLLMSSMNCICGVSSIVEVSNCRRNWSLVLGSSSEASNLKVFSLWSLATLRLLRVDSLAVESVDRKLEVAMHSLTISLTSSLWLIEAVGRPLYPGVAIFEKACVTTWGLSSNFSPATGYQLPLFGGLVQLRGRRGSWSNHFALVLKQFGNIVHQWEFQRRGTRGLLHAKHVRIVSESLT